MAASTGQSMSQEEMFKLFQEFLAAKRNSHDKFVPLQNHPNHRGLIDADYVRPTPVEFPKMLYHSVLQPKIVQSREEQNALGSAWQETPVVHPIDWKAKANEVFTKSGFQVRTHHVEFLKSAGVQGIETMREAADFLDRLNQAEQEQFFLEAETQTPEPVSAEVSSEAEQPAKRGKKKAA